MKITAENRFKYNENSVNIVKDKIIDIKDKISFTSDRKAENEIKKWTVMLYSAGDNNLRRYLYDDINELETVGSDKNTNIITLMDQGSSNCRIYDLEKDSDLSRINSPVLKEMGNTDMANPLVLADFIRFSMKNYPAENYALIISDHGGGWEGAVEDDSYNNWMTMEKLKKGLEIAKSQTGNKIDVLGFDACLMANTEAVYQLKDQAKFIVASEQNIGADGWPYAKIFSREALVSLQRRLNNKLDMSPRDFSKKIVTSSNGFNATNTMSALEMNNMENLALSLKNFSSKVIENKISADTLKKLVYDTEGFSSLNDLGDFLSRFIADNTIKNDEMKDLARNALEEMRNVIIAEQHSSIYPGANGLTIQLESENSEKYNNLDFVKRSGWDNFVRYIYKQKNC